MKKLTTEQKIIRDVKRATGRTIDQEAIEASLGEWHSASHPVHIAIAAAIRRNRR